MATKLELKQHCKELSDALELLRQDNEHHKMSLVSAQSENYRLQNTIVGLRENLENWRKIGKRVIYMIAYDLAANRTHRQRNEQMRYWLATLKDAMENLFYSSDIDEIPF